jgi:metallo-beta-lactamase family protein
MINITFCGGAKSVTGANYLVDNGKTKFLVDCGMVQGSQDAEMLNHEPFGYDPATIDFMVATHAHIDHIGRIPKLFLDGFEGKVYSTYPTKDFGRIILEDAVDIMYRDRKDLPIYNKENVDQAVARWRGKEYGEIIEYSQDVSFRFLDAGHILGSSIVEVWVMDHQENKTKKIVFSGDLGNIPSVLLRNFEYVDKADYVLIESAYGDRLHEDNATRKDKLKQAIKDIIARQGVLLMPIFAVERTQDILYEINDIVENHGGTGKILGRVGKIDVFLDSPLAIDATDIHRRYTKYYNRKAKELMKKDDVFDFPFFVMTPARKDSVDINFAPNPKMIMAGSGMSDGGRIGFHQERYLSDPNNMIVFVGYQPEGSLGRRILEGRETVIIHGQEVKNKIEVRTIDGYSAHADQAMLLDWVGKIKDVKKVFVVQGDPKASEILAGLIKEKFGVEAESPEHNSEIKI